MRITGFLLVLILTMPVVAITMPANALSFAQRELRKNPPPPSVEVNLDVLNPTPTPAPSVMEIKILNEDTSVFTFNSQILNPAIKKQVQQTPPDFANINVGEQEAYEAIPKPKRRPNKFMASKEFIARAVKQAQKSAQTISAPYKKITRHTTVYNRNGKQLNSNSAPKPQDNDLDGTLQNPTAQEILKHIE